MVGEGGSGIDLALWDRLFGIGVAVRLGDRFGLRVAGADAERYLNGQVTNDVRLATGDRPVYACVTDARGRLEGELWIRREERDGSFLLDAPLALEETLPARLEKYAIADDVSFDRAAVPDWHVMGGGRGLGTLRFGLPGHDGGERPEGLDEISLAEADCIRVAMGLPGWGRELLPGMLPPEAGIEALAISYQKGCYVGQEVISRIRRAGKVNRSLCYLVACDAVDGMASEDLAGRRLLSADGAPAGSVTSAAFHPRLDRWVALAYVKRGAGSASETPEFFLEEGSHAGSVSFAKGAAPYKEAIAHA